MIKVLDEKSVLIVEFDEMPDLPITLSDTDRSSMSTVMLDALNKAIEEEEINEPGMWGIQVDLNSFGRYIFHIGDSEAFRENQKNA